MAREINRLSARSVQSAAKPGRHSDGGGLYLVVDKGGAKRWVFLYRCRATQRLREMGLGGFANVPLAKAREKAAQARGQLAAGIDPLSSRGTKLDQPTFGEMAEHFIEAMAASWKSEKHRSQWESTLATYCASIQDLPVGSVTTEHVLAVLQPIWQRIPETASRVRSRIEQILDAAKAKGMRLGENPARWRGHLDRLLPSRGRVRKVKHHAALSYSELPAFMQKLRAQNGVSARALEHLILTATRTSETLDVVFDEFASNELLWTIPAERMKGGVEHRVPLHPRVVEIIKQQSKVRQNEFVFPGTRPGRPLSQTAMLMLLRRMGYGHVTAHGFRSTFRDWAGDRTTFPREVAEAALAHAVPNEVEAAYLRGTFFEKRRKLMAAWANYCLSVNNVANFARSGTS